ncbi:MAG: Cysteine desulfuration protein SufE [Chlamydiae bacterium]|nr:Cysteine desulfuration protein SufE [Chlamydiota bacterium]
MEFSSCLTKQDKLKEQFLSLNSQEKLYEKIISLGRALPPFPKEDEIEENRVKGCQSILYLKMTLNGGKMEIITSSDALISAGLAALLISVYQNEPPEAIFQCPPHFLKEIGILNALSPGRSNGLRSLYLHMQRSALLLNSK